MGPDRRFASRCGRFDRDANGRVEFAEFRALGAALLDVAATAARSVNKPKAGVGGTFARRDAAEEHRMHFAAGRIQALSRQRSLERARLCACGKAKAN